MPAKTVLRLSAISGVLAAVSFTLPALAQDKDGKEDEKKTPTIEKKVEKFDLIEGFFPLYRDPENGDLYMEISEDRLGEEFISFTYSENSATEAGFFRGAYLDQKILEPNRYYDKIEIVEKSTAFYFDPDKALSRASDANISPSVVASLNIAAKTDGEGEDGQDRYLVKTNGLFLSEALQQLKPSPDPEAPQDRFSAGDLSKDKTRFAEIRNYPLNTDIIVDYVFDNKYPRNGGSDAVTDARSVTLKVQHSFIAMPEDGFEPRIDDYRVGYFFDRVTDLTTDDAAPFRDMINRWRLVKKDPEADLSEPVTPITWWIENTTPVEYRDVIRDATLAWNLAFEKAGFKNAVEVKVQPDDADWDAGDIRYNVLRWTSSPNPPFGGYGPSFTNPRTGEIIGADIMLEYVFLTNRLAFSEIFEAAAVSAPQKNLLAMSGEHGIHCSAGHELHMNNLFGLAALQAQGAGDGEMSDLVKEGLYYLILHEVGHTLGLNHNMKASSVWGPREVHDASVTKGAPTGSVMDYPALNMAPPGVTQGDYYMQRPGFYDDWAIEFGYRPDLDDAARTALLANSGDPKLAFGNDADDMRAPGRGIDPRTNIGDMSSDPVAYAQDRIDLVQDTLPGLVSKFDDENSWQALTFAYLITSGQQAGMANVMSRQVGGVYVERTAPGENSKQPYTPVPRERQIAAMEALAEDIFAADAFAISDDLITRLQPQRRGFNFYGNNEDPKLHARVLNIQMNALNHLLNPVVLQRMVDSSLYGGDYAPAEMLLDLNDGIFGDDLKGTPNAFRQNLQVAYLERLIGMVDNPEYSPVARAAALSAADDVSGRMGMFDFGLSTETKAHRLQIKRILAGLE